ncbi:MAG: phospholipid carrier-dependent glycosyltransferase [Lentisphaerota bacterium]
MRRIYLLIIGLFIILYIVPLGLRPLFTPDEPRYAEIARELIVHNDWVVPKINNLRYFEKPIMGHWLNAASLKLFGENNFAVRFASALAAGLTGLALFMLLKKFAGDSMALWGTVIFLSSVLVYGIGTFAVLDGPTSFFLTAGMTGFFFAYMEKRWNTRKITALLLFGLFCGLAFLTKGFLAFVVPAIIIGPFLIWEKRWKELFILPWIPALAVIVTVLPWSLMIHCRDNDFWNYFFWVEHVQRFLQKEESQHPAPFWFFIPVIIAGSIPWLFLIQSILSGYKERCVETFKQPLMRYAACWLVLPFLFFSASSGKLATYILPCFPPLAILIACGLDNFTVRNKPGKIDLTLKILLSVLAVTAVVLITAQIVFSTGFRIKHFEGLYGKDELFKFTLVIAAIALWCSLLWMAINAKDLKNKIAFFALGPLGCFFAWNAAVPNLALDVKAPERILMKHAARITPDTMLVSYKNLLTSICWYYKRDDVYIYSKAGELEYGISKPDSVHRLLSKEDFEAKVQATPRQRILIILESPRLIKELPVSTDGVIENKILFQEYK